MKRREHFLFGNMSSETKYNDIFKKRLETKVEVKVEGKKIEKEMKREE